MWATFSSRFSGHLRVRPFPLILPLFVCIQLNRGLQGTICRPSGAARGAGAARRDQRSLSLTLALSFGQFVSLTTKKQDISNLSTETAHRHTHTHTHTQAPTHRQTETHTHTHTKIYPLRLYFTAQASVCTLLDLAEICPRSDEIGRGLTRSDEG